MQPAQPAALELDHAGAGQVGDARDLGPRVRPRAADASAQGEDAALGPGHARQAAPETQDGAAQGALAAQDLRGATVAGVARGAVLCVLATGAARTGAGR